MSASPTEATVPVLLYQYICNTANNVETRRGIQELIG